MKLLFIDLSKISNTKIYVLLGLLILIIYGNAINNEYSLDDDLVVYRHQVVDNGIKSTKDIFTTYTTKGETNTIYRPLPLLSYAIEKQFFSSFKTFQSKEEKVKSDKLTQANVSHFINIIIYFTII